MHVCRKVLRFKRGNPNSQIEEWPNEKEQTSIYKTPSRKLKIEQHELNTEGEHM